MEREEGEESPVVTGVVACPVDEGVVDDGSVEATASFGEVFEAVEVSVAEAVVVVLSSPAVAVDGVPAGLVEELDGRRLLPTVGAAVRMRSGCSVVVDSTERVVSSGTIPDPVSPVLAVPVVAMVTSALSEAVVVVLTASIVELEASTVGLVVSVW